MPDYSLVPVDYQPDFDGYSLVPVDYDPLAADGLAQQAEFQQPPTPAQPQPQRQPQQPATGAGQPGVNGPATGNSPSGSEGGGIGPAGAMREVARTRLRIKSERPNLFPSAALPIRHLRSLLSTVKR